MQPFPPSSLLCSLSARGAGQGCCPGRAGSERGRSPPTFAAVLRRLPAQSGRARLLPWLLPRLLPQLLPQPRSAAERSQRRAGRGQRGADGEARAAARSHRPRAGPAPRGGDSAEAEPAEQRRGEPQQPPGSGRMGQVCAAAPGQGQVNRSASCEADAGTSNLGFLPQIKASLESEACSPSKCWNTAISQREPQCSPRPPY